MGWFPDLEILLDGRNGLRDVAYPDRVRVLGMGVPPRGRAPRASGPAASGAGG